MSTPPDLSNYINLAFYNDNGSGEKEIILTMFVDHKPMGWLRYNAVQLDDLIQAMQEARKNLG
jgi:hypothetical protein